MSKPIAVSEDNSPSRSSSQLETGTARTGRSRTSSVHSNNSSSHGGYSLSPIRPVNHSSLSNPQRLRNPSIQSSSGTGSTSQRRSSLNGLRDVGDFSSSIGMPYTYSVNSVSHLNPQYSLNSASTLSGPRTGTDLRGSTSSRSSPRSSFSNYDVLHAELGSRRYSEHSQRKPSAEEVFDLMEREQDAIVLKLMREISQLKEDNRALLSTINQLTSGNSGHNYRSASQSRSSVDSRRNSSVIIDDSDVSSKMFIHKKDLKPATVSTTQ